MGMHVKVEAGVTSNTTPVFVTAVVESDGPYSLSTDIELRIGEPTLAGKTRLVHLTVAQAEQIAEALKDAALEISDAIYEHKRRLKSPR